MSWHHSGGRRADPGAAWERQPVQRLPPGSCPGPPAGGSGEDELGRCVAQSGPPAGPSLPASLECGKRTLGWRVGDLIRLNQITLTLSRFAKVLEEGGRGLCGLGGPGLTFRGLQGSTWRLGRAGPAGRVSARRGFGLVLPSPGPWVGGHAAPGRWPHPVRPFQWVLAFEICIPLVLFFILLGLRQKKPTISVKEGEGPLGRGAAGRAGRDRDRQPSRRHARATCARMAHQLSGLLWAQTARPLPRVVPGLASWRGRRTWLAVVAVSGRGPVSHCSPLFCFALPRMGSCPPGLHAVCK